MMEARFSLHAPRQACQHSLAGVPPMTFLENMLQGRDHESGTERKSSVCDFHNENYTQTPPQRLLVTLLGAADELW
jgi:hypothetical protein